jgi:beta-N-acetylhexosaminidase
VDPGPAPRIGRVISRAGELLAVGFEGTTLPDDVSELAAGAGLGGIVLFTRNCPDLDTVVALTGAAHRLGPDVLVLVDHEGGRVHRLPPPFTRFPPAATVARAGDPELVAAVARAMARELRAAGFDSGLTPVLDSLTASASLAIGDRAYGSDPDTVAACGLAFVRAALLEGLVPVAKHFPGHGRTPLDSHLVLPEVDAPIGELERTDLLPFRRVLAAGCPAVLVAHVRYPELDADWPASLSAEVIGGLLRGRLRHDGLVLSDDLEMAAVRSQWGVPGAAIRFLEAGGDVALVCRDAAARHETAERVRRGLESGVLPPAAILDARRRRMALRASVERAGPRPDASVIGCPEHRDLAAEILGRAGEPPAPAPPRP